MTRSKLMFAALTCLLFPTGFAAAYDPYAPPQSYDPYAPPRNSGPSPYDKGRQGYDYKNEANMRFATPCRLKLSGEDVFPDVWGRCNIGRGVGPDRDRTTIIMTRGYGGYKIIREDYSNRVGTFYGSGRPIPVTGRGGCWEGDGLLFCAN